MEHLLEQMLRDEINLWKVAYTNLTVESSIQVKRLQADLAYADEVIEGLDDECDDLADEVADLQDESDDFAFQIEWLLAGL